MWLAIVIALIGGIGSVAAVFQGRSAVKKAQEMAQYKVDAGAYTRAQDIYEGSITELRVQLADLRSENVKLRQRVSELETQVITLRDQ